MNTFIRQQGRRQTERQIYTVYYTAILWVARLNGSSNGMCNWCYRIPSWGLLHLYSHSALAELKACTSSHQLTCDNSIHWSLYGCWAAIFTVTHTTWLMTESLQCRVVTWNFCSLKFVTNFAYFQIPLLCVTFIAKYSFNHQVNKKYRQSSGKSITDTSAKVLVLVLPTVSAESNHINIGDNICEFR